MKYSLERRRERLPDSRMSSKPQKDDSVLLLHSVAIVLKVKRAKRRSRSGDNSSRANHANASHCPGSGPLAPGPTPGPTSARGSPGASTQLRGGEDLFEDFVKENQLCHWNPHLEESIRSLKYSGCLHPSTILVTAREIFLDTIKSAWSRRALRPPPQYNITGVGDVHGIVMNEISQTQFTPLPEALCQIISDITLRSSASVETDLMRRLTLGASLDAILDRLQETYHALQQPSEHIVYETLGSLMKERKIFHTGSGYGIVSPESFRLNGCITVQDNNLVIGGGPDSLVIPLPPLTTSSSSSPTPPLPPPGGGVSISIQTDDAPPLQRSMSVKEEGANSVEILRTQSLKEEHDGSLSKNINLKTSDLHQEKDKGEKSSLLNKLFGRNKSKRPNSSGRSSLEAEASKHYVTFSAQFPPQEWLWYEEHSRPTGDAASETNSDLDQCPLHALPLGIPGFMDLADGKAYTEDPSGFFEKNDDVSHESGGEKGGGEERSKGKNKTPRKVRHKRKSKVKSEEEEEEVEEVLNNVVVVERPPTHVSRVFRKYREMKGHSFLSNDIRVEEFTGKIDKKLSVGKSRESGVNCVGLEAPPKLSSPPPLPPTLPSLAAQRIIHEDSGFISPRTNENLYESIASQPNECFSDSSRQTVVVAKPLNATRAQRRPKNEKRLLNCVASSQRFSVNYQKEAEKSKDDVKVVDKL